MSSSNAVAHFTDRLIDRVIATRSHLVVGLDPDLSELPAELLDGVDDLGGAAAAAGRFCVALIDGVSEHVAAVKPQSAFFEQFGSAGVAALEMVIAHAHSVGLLVIEDAKRGDIGSTMAAYAATTIGSVRIGGRDLAAHDSDAVTVSPYLGPQSLEPMLEVGRPLGKGIFVLVRTSNPGSAEIQGDLTELGSEPLYLKVAAMVARLGASNIGKHGYGDVGAVTGLTYPQEAPGLRAAMPDSYFLVPGLGAQGGKPEDFAEFLNGDGLGAVAAASRSISGAWRNAPQGGAILDLVRTCSQAATLATSQSLNNALEAADRLRF